MVIALIVTTFIIKLVIVIIMLVNVINIIVIMTVIINDVMIRSPISPASSPDTEPELTLRADVALPGGR